MESCPAHPATPMRIHTILQRGRAITRLVCARVRKAKIPLSPLLAKAGLTIEQIDDDSCRLKANSEVSSCDRQPKHYGMISWGCTYRVTSTCAGPGFFITSWHHQNI